jgi:pimeloyl-ACP methyl ester carboxylesterase
MLKRTVLSLIAAATIAVAAPLAVIAQESPMQMPQLPAPTEAGYADVNGVKLWYQTYGEGKPLVVIHGGFGMVEMFAPILGRLAEGRKVIGVDLQAHGRTGPLGRPMTYEAMAADVAGLIKSLGYEKADVLGYSLGAATALRLAIDHPEVVDRLVTISAAWSFANWHEYNFQGMRAIATDPAGTAEGMKQTPMYEMWAAVAKDVSDWPKMLEEFAALLARDYDWSAEVPNITSPTLVAVGDWDAVRIGEATKLFEMLGGGAQDALWDRSGMNQNRFAVLPNTSHYDILTSPTLLDVVVPFLNGYPQQSE